MVAIGTKVTCPECGTAIAEISGVINPGDPIVASLFKGLTREIKNGEKMTCHMCDAGYFDSGKIHTESGWAV